MNQLKNQKVTFEKANEKHSNKITYTSHKHPKSGPRTYLKGDNEKYSKSPLWCTGCGFGSRSCKCDKEKK